MSGLLSLRKFVAPEIIYGIGARNLVGNYARNFSSSRVLIVTDPGIIKAGWLVDVQKSLEEAGLSYVVFSAISPNPRSKEVREGARFYIENECNVIVAIGGGSPMDCAKGIGIMVTNNDDIIKFEGVDKIRIPIPPLIFIPTTAGSSADVSQFSIITNENEKVKIAIVSKTIVPDIALIDPETTITMDSYLTSCTAIDALVHAIEAYVSTGSGPLTDSYAEEAIKLIANNLPALKLEPSNIEYRNNIMLASMKAGLAFSNAILGAVHAMAHSLGGYMDLAHGECNAMLLEHVVNYNFSSADEKYRRIAELMGVKVSGLNSRELKYKLINSIISLKKEAGIQDSLENKGVNISDIPILSKKAVKDACMITNPRKAVPGDIEAIYREAM